MATLTHAESRPMYSWWWDSHIYPKTSKWLQENLTDVDAKVKKMITLIEEDADSFASRAEMFYEKRPELMKLVEELYRAYRALAERYDHATGALHQARRSIARAFPNQVPLVPADDYPCTPEMQSALFGPVELQKDVCEISISPSYGITAAKHRPNFFEGKARKGLNFEEEEEASCTSAIELVGKSKNEIQNDPFAKLEADKDAGLAQYEQALDRLSKLELEVSHAQEDSKRLDEQASKAETEVQSLRESLRKLDAEKEDALLNYEQCMDRIRDLENCISCAQIDYCRLETETQALKLDHSRLGTEKEGFLLQLQQSLDLISNLEGQLLHSEEAVARINESANKAESEVENLKLALLSTTKEKDAAVLQCQQNSEKISNLEHEILHVQEESQRLSGEKDCEMVKLKDTEERCFLLERSNKLLHSDLESMVVKIGSQSQELIEKQKEIRRLYNCLQEERMRFVEIESTFRNLQLMHSHAHEELIFLIAELQNAAQILKDAEARNQGLQDVSQNVDVENRSLNDLSLPPAASVGNLQHEISRLRDMSLQLVEEFGIRVDQRNALLHEIYRLKEELNDLNRRLRDLTEQINSLGLNPECFGSSVKELQDEISKLREISRNEKIEKVSFFKKLESLESVIGENNSLKEALSNLHAELDVLRRSIAVFEESFQSVVGEKLALVDEKGVLGSQLQIISQKFKISLEKNGCLDKSLSEAGTEVEGLRAKLKILESLFQFLDNEKSGLITERDTLASQFTITTLRLRDLENKYKHLEERHSGLENDKESVLQKLEDLSASLDVQKQEHAWFTQSSETRLAGVEAQILLLQDEGGNGKKEFEEGLDKSVNFQVEIFILKKCIQDLEDKNLSLLVDCEKFLRVCKLSKRMISELELEKTEQQMEVKSLNDHVMDLRMMMSQICNALDIDSVDERPYEDGKAQLVMNQVLCKLEETRTALCSIQDENQQLAIEKSVLVTVLGQLKEEAANLVTQKNTIDWELRIITTQLSALQNNTQKFWQLNDELSLKLRERDHKEKLLTDEMEGLFGNLLDFQGACEDLKCENFKLLEEQRYLLKKLLEVEEQKHSLEGESPVILGEALSLSFLSVILMNIVNEKCVEQKEVSENLDKLHGLNIALRERVSELEGNMEMAELENFLLKESFERSEHGLKAEKIVSEQLNNEIACKKNLLCQTGMELLGSEQKLTAMKNEKATWHKMIEDLDREYHAVKVIKEDQEKQILKLTEENDHWNNEDERLHETIKRLEADLFKLDDANEATKIREERLRSELKKRKNEAELWQNEAESLFGEFQASAVQESFLEEKLSEVCESFLDHMSSKDIEIGQLNEKLSAFESENGELKFQLASYDPAIADIKDCMTSLENHMSLQRRFRKAENMEIKAVEGSNSETKKFQKLSQDQIPRFKSNPDLQGSQARILAAMRKIDELDSQSNLSGENFRTGNWWPDDGLKPMRSMPRIGERGNDLFTKDIMLDHMFESSSHRISKSEHFKANPALELWETTDQNHSIGLKAGKYPIGDASLGILIDKELGADILEISDSFREHTRREGNKRKILERLSSDAQNLTNLGITVQDLRRKVEFTEKGRKGKGIEYDTVRLQLEEVEEDILKLFDTNGKLMKDAQENFSSLKGKSASKLEESGSFRKRRVSEQARKGSEKIGRLQSVVQKIQFLLLKLDDEKQKKARTKIPERKARVLLQDYLYGAIRTNYSRQKKNHFCSCAQPPTRGD